MSQTLDDLLNELAKLEHSSEKVKLSPNQLKTIQSQLTACNFSISETGNFMRGGLLGGLAALAKGNLESEIEKFLGFVKPPNIRSDRETAVLELPPGTPVYCNLAVLAEHTGVTLPDGNIAQLNGNGKIESVTPEAFVNRLDGLNPARIIRYPRALDGKILHSAKAGERARQNLGKTRQYNMIFDNCHQFAYGCLSGNFENSNNFFWMFNDGIRELFDQEFNWCIWDYFE